VTGALFIAAATLVFWRMAVLYVMTVVLATQVARLLKAAITLLDPGLCRFNVGLMGLALGNNRG
jgi:hypothetical protein